MFDAVATIFDPAGSCAPALRLPAIPGLPFTRGPGSDGQYVISADLAEGNPTSDESALCVLDATTGEQIAALAGKFEPPVFANAAALPMALR